MLNRKEGLKLFLFPEEMSLVELEKMFSDIEKHPSLVQNLNEWFFFFNQRYFYTFLFFFIPSFCFSGVFLADGTLRVTSIFFDFFYYLLLLKLDHNSQFSVLLDLSGVDFFAGSFRFLLVSVLYSPIYHNRCVFNIWFNNKECLRKWIYAIFLIFKPAFLFEQEAFKMFGVSFSKRLDLRRIINDYGINSDPNRKDFPICGFYRIFFDEKSQRITCSSTERYFQVVFLELEFPWGNFFY